MKIDGDQAWMVGTDDPVSFFFKSHPLSLCCFFFCGVAPVALGKAK